jgi:predicted nuclease of predicted toxin-antitoxin system
LKLLLDQNLSYRLVGSLADLFPNSSQVRLHGLDRAEDEAIWRWAALGDDLIVTLDADFAEMVALRGPPPEVVRLRCGSRPTTYIADLLRRHAPSILAMQQTDEDCLEIE